MALAAPALEDAAPGRTADLSRLISVRYYQRSGRHIMTRTAHELAEFLGCTLEGDATVKLSGVASAYAATVNDLIYVEKGSHLKRVAASQARCVVIAPKLALEGKTLLRASNPKLAFAKAATWLVPPVP